MKPREGRVFGRLTVLHVAEYSTIGDGKHKYLCSCACGGEKIVSWTNLRRGYTKSCGCLHAENLAMQKAIGAANKQRKAQQRAQREADKFALLVDGVPCTKHPLWETYKGMVRRCYNPKNDNYWNYGAKGIAVCARWLGNKNNATVAGFRNFVSDMGAKPSKSHTLDRIDGTLGYCKENCRWATPLEQFSNIQNVRCVRLATIRGKTARVTQWCRQLGISDKAVSKLIKLGLSNEHAIFTAWLNKKTWLSGGTDHAKNRECALALVAKYCGDEDI